MFWTCVSYGDFKDLTRKTASDKILCDKVFNISKNPKYNIYQYILLECSINLSIKKIVLVVLKVSPTSPL